MFDDDRKLICTALKSGRYKKGRDYLRKGDCYDVLGVLCELFPSPEWGWEKFDDTEGQPLSDLYVFTKKDKSDTHVAGLPEYIQNRLEFSDDDVSLLVALNDGVGDWHERPKTFEQIADWIDFKF